MEVMMSKPGDEYQEVVGDIYRALDPKASIRVGEWVEGPDGEREVDVQVRCQVDGKPHFTLIECKDWKRRVDIQEIDKLASKSSDLQADFAILVSNSGFSDLAVRKATRVGLGLASAVCAGNPGVPWRLKQLATGKYIELGSHALYLVVDPRDRQTLDVQSAEDLHLDGLPVARWLEEEVRTILREEERDGAMRVQWKFSSPPPLRAKNYECRIWGFRLDISWRVKWLSRIIDVDLKQGFYDHIKKRVEVPGGESLTLGPIDTHASAWTELPSKPEEWYAPPSSTGLKLLFGFMNGFAGEYEVQDVPHLSAFVRERDVQRFASIMDDNGQEHRQ